ncbi:aminomethyl-transferring glycine dehydrogenase subunit GcvPA [Halodesulfurarchaeum formicicum]|uniref:glycine dehydrogenase (aminomethyl-transferring) n=1 Tax=Halodesulfurarchaeum formicicum TaxID=1873524 RepID=A0A1J1AAX7_9EURY|nr:aminomethyl-transferring glycine dehydrogenase subunit GcvPA [Halodesulfurarchaeum formicicum]APE94952.1 glycine dehydrogenase subunit 1 [Halodesulfurarchaeum formicicum]
MSGSPYAPNTETDTSEMLDAVGVSDVEELFDIPEPVRFDGEFDIESRSEPAVLNMVSDMLGNNDDMTEFLGRGYYDHYVPSVVDRLSLRSEFLTSYTQYQPEVTQGFLQALFEYQSILVELTGLPVANASMYDAASGLAEAALLASRIRDADGTDVLVPEYVREERVSVLENYVAGHDIHVKRVGTADGTLDIDALTAAVDEDTLMVYAESPTTRGTIEEHLAEIGEIAHENDAMFTVASDPVAMSILEAPGDLGADVVVGDAVLGMPNAYGMGLGIFATRDDYLRHVPGRLIGIGEDQDGKRAFTLTLQTREQHIRRERATSNICTNQAWVALRTAIHAASLGPDGLVDLAEQMVELPRDLAAQLDALPGIEAPIHDRHHFREFVARTEAPASEIVAALEDEGFAVQAVDDHELQFTVTETNEHAVDDLIAAVEEVVA